MLLFWLSFLIENFSSQDAIPVAEGDMILYLLAGVNYTCKHFHVFFFFCVCHLQARLVGLYLDTKDYSKALQLGEYMQWPYFILASYLHDFNVFFMFFTHVHHSCSICTSGWWSDVLVARIIKLYLIGALHVTIYGWSLF